MWRGRTSDVHAAVDAEDLPRDVRRLVAREVDARRGDLARGAGAAERDRPSAAAPSSASVIAVRHVGVDEAGRDDVDGDVARRVLARDRLRGADERRLGRGVGGLPGVAHLADDAREEDRRARSWLRIIDLRRGARAGERALHVDVEEARRGPRPSGGGAGRRWRCRRWRRGCRACRGA